MKRHISVLHIAAFDGNIGDVANHEGFRQSLNLYSKFEFEFTNMEMRNFYQSWQISHFDTEFVNKVNEYDLIVFGGGGFFQTNIIMSSTGVTIDLSPEILCQIRKPILFNCLGVGGDEESNEECVKRFDSFLNIICNNENYFVSVRNDGSYERINYLYDSRYRDKVLRVPDGGFFMQPVPSEHAEINQKNINIAINVACDKINVRFPKKNGYINEEEFVEEFSNFCNDILAKRDDIRLVFVPHIMSDLKMISQVVSKINDRFVRQRITCAACLNGTETDGINNFDLYRCCNLVIGMRYHANVVPIGMNIPTLAIFNIETPMRLYNDLGINHRCIPSNISGFSDVLMNKALNVLDNPHDYQEENNRINIKNKQDNINYIERIDNWLMKILQNNYSRWN